MNKKLLTLAVAAAVAAPTAALAEAVLYGRLHQSIDYVDITNATTGRPDRVSGYGFEGYEDRNVSRNVWVYDNMNVDYPLQDGTTGNFGVPGWASFTDLQGNPVSTDLQGAPGAPVVAYNTSNVNVTVNYLDQAGIAQTATLAPGQSFTYPNPINQNVILQTAGDPITDVRTGVRALIRVDANGNPVYTGPANAPQDFSGWGVSGRDWRNYTTVNPLTGIEDRAVNRSNRLGVKGSEDLGNGLKAVYQVEFGLDNMNGGEGVTYRNTFAGIASDFGTLLVGRHDTPLKISTGKLDLFSDTMADYNGTVGFHDLRTDKTIAYISPSFSGVSFAGALVTGGGRNNTNNDSFSSSYSLALIYNNGPFFASAAYESMGNENFMDQATSTLGKAGCTNAITGLPLDSCGYVDDDFSKWRLGLGLLDWNGFTLTGVYEQQDNLPAGQVYNTVGYIDPNGNVSIVQQTGIEEQRLWQIQAGYSFGNNMVKAMYGAVDRDAGRVLGDFRTNPRSISNLTSDLGGDRETWAIGFDHNFSKRTKAYALYTDVTDDLSDDIRVRGAEWSGFSMGLMHSF